MAVVRLMRKLLITPNAYATAVVAVTHLVIVSDALVVLLHKVSIILDYFLFY